MSFRQVAFLPCFLLVFVSIGAGAQLLTAYFQDAPAVADVASGPAMAFSLDSTVEEANQPTTESDNEHPVVERKRKVAVVMASAEDLLRIAPPSDRPATSPPPAMPTPQTR